MSVPLQARTVVNLVSGLSTHAEDVPPGLDLFLMDPKVPPPCFKRFTMMLYRVMKMGLQDVYAMLILFDRLMKKNKLTYLPNATMHQLWLTVAVVVRKSLYDQAYSNADVAALCRIPLTYLNAMELQLLTLLDWEVYIAAEDYQRTAAAAEYLAAKEGPEQKTPTPPSPPVSEAPKAPRLRFNTPILLTPVDA
eukprot:TRINITY_DN4097_c0_g2_i2.p1 TRINITY_DN4097_c0_g2~~TRINITY_DN4097_c0_g2_i2.p1  ORF type:complete len:193 (+),score=70.05 TRINITY_DN4097_c0_g2_i2:55-633(+)